MLKQPLCEKAPVCQKCGDTGFREILIVCRQCRKNCEHKYCLFKFPKKGEKIRWYCEECKPTIFPVSTPEELEVDTERSKVDLKCNQTFQNLTAKSQGVSIISQPEKVQEKVKSLKSPSSDVDENRTCKKEIRPTFSNKDCIDQNVPNTSLTHSSPPTIFGETVHEVYVHETTVHRNNSHQEIVVHNPVSFLEKLEVDSERSKYDLKRNLQNQEAKSQGVSSSAQLEEVQDEAKGIKSPSSDVGENITSKKETRLILFDKDYIDQNIPSTSLTHSPPLTTNGETVHEVSVPETIAHKNNSHQENVVYSSKSFPKKLEVDIGRSKVDLKCDQTLQDQKTKSQGVSNSAQFEKVQEAQNTKFTSSDVGENQTSNKEIIPILSNKDYIDQNVLNAPLTHSPPPDTCGEIAHRDNSHQEIVVQAPETFNQTIPFIARPIINCVWRGCISFGDDEFLPFRAHGSSIACQRVFDAVNSFPPVFAMNKHLISDISQTLFKGSPPTDEKIGLYIFPGSYARPERVAHLIDDIIKKDLMFVYTLDEVEMLVFSSYILPEQHQRFEGQYYLWGAFRKKQLPKAATAPNNYLELTNEGKENSQDKQKPKASNIALSESEKTAAKARKKHTENKKETYRTTLKGPISENINGINKKHARDEDENQRSFEKVSKKYKQEEIFSVSHSKLTKKQKLVKEAKGKLVENNETHANTTNRIYTKQELADSLKKQSIADFFASSYVSDFYRKENVNEAPHNEKHRQEEDETNTNDVVASTCTEKQKPAQEVVNESEKRVMDRNEIHSKGPAAEMHKLVSESKKRDMDRNETFASNTVSLALKKQKLSCTSIPINKCTEKKWPIDKSNERGLKSLEETSKKIAGENENICDDAFTNTCIQQQKYDEEKENRYGGDEGGNVASKQLPLEEIGKKLVCNGNELASTPLLRGSPTPNNNSIVVPKSDEEKVKNDRGDGNYELEEGEIVDMEIEGKGRGDENADDHCLTLFPLQVEEMGVTSKGGSASKLSLDLGLGRN